MNSACDRILRGVQAVEALRNRESTLIRSLRGLEIGFRGAAFCAVDVGLQIRRIECRQHLSARYGIAFMDEDRCRRFVQVARDGDVLIRRNQSRKAQFGIEPSGPHRRRHNDGQRCSDGRRCGIRMPSAAPASCDAHGECAGSTPRRPGRAPLRSLRSYPHGARRSEWGPPIWSSARCRRSNPWRRSRHTFDL